MKPSIRLPLALVTLLPSTLAFPLLTPYEAYHNIHQLRPRASYSVVAVDGGSSATAEPTPDATTVISTATDLITHTQTLMQTKLSTVVITQGASPTTLIVTVTSASATKVVETPPPNTKIVTSVSVSVQTPPTPAPTTVQGSASTVTVTDSMVQTQTVAPETAPYDNGQWHTTYFYSVETPAPTPGVPAAAGPGSVDDGSWAKWSGNTGQWQGPPKA